MKRRLIAVFGIISTSVASLVSVVSCGKKLKEEYCFIQRVSSKQTQVIQKAVDINKYLCVIERAADGQQN